MSREMDQVEKELKGAMEAQGYAVESDRVEDFKRKSTKRFFATLSAFIDSDWYKKQNQGNDEISWKRYCDKATNQLQSDLKRLGLEYQKVTGAWFGSMENSFLVWNTAYTFEQFQALMLKLNENYKQWGICIGKWMENQYSVDLWETKSLDDIKYGVTKHFSRLSLTDGLKEFGTILTRHLYSKEGKIDSTKTKAIKFESLQENICCAASESLVGAYKRDSLLKEFLGKPGD